jgi:hypothetical protein
MRLAVALLLVLAAPALASEDVRTEAAGLRFTVPKGWERVPTASPMRAAQFRIPRAGGKQEDGEFIVFRFDVPKGGTTSDFVGRWYRSSRSPTGGPRRTWPRSRSGA